MFSYDQPITPASSEFKVEFPDFSVLTFNYRVIQLNQQNWRNFLTQQNPVAAALMAKMRIELVTFLLTSRLGPLSPLLNHQIQGLGLFQVERLGRQSLSFGTVAGLASWLADLEALEGFEGEKAEILGQLRRRVGAIAPKQKQKLLSLSNEQWQTLPALEFDDINALNSWLEERASQQGLNLLG